MARRWSGSATLVRADHAEDQSRSGSRTQGVLYVVTRSIWSVLTTDQHVDLLVSEPGVTRWPILCVA